MPSPVARRGLTYSSVRLKDKNIVNVIFTPTSQGVYAIDAKDGSILSLIGRNGVYGNSLSVVAPIVLEKNIITGTMNSTIESYDIFSGEKIWETSLIKEKNLEYRAAVWSGISYDENRKAVYVTTSNAGFYNLAKQFTADNRPGSNL